MNSGILLGHFTSPKEAQKARRSLARQGFRRSAVVHKDHNGELHLSQPFLWYRALAMSLAALFGGGMAILGTTNSGMTVANYGIIWSVLAPGLVGGLLGAMAGFAALRRSNFDIGRPLLLEHGRLLVGEEAVLILQAPIERLTLPSTLLNSSSEAPSVFVMHPIREKRRQARRSGTLLSLAQLKQHAAQLAAQEQKKTPEQHNFELIDRLKRARSWIRRVCIDLTTASQLEQTTTPAAEWILDNEYIIERNARDVLLNLPRRFYQQLPVCSDKPYQDQPCIYGLAKQLVFHTELRLDHENITTFLEAYQSVSPLTIRELWAMPQMLRIALIEGIQNLAITTLADLRERQLAAFWANRLITTNRRAPDRLLPVLAELTTSIPQPSPYFGAQLIGYLHDEYAALLPAQQWLERALNSSLHDINTREQNRQTKEQLESANAFGSLKQLDLMDWRKLFERLSHVEQVLADDPAGIYPKMDFATRDRCRSLTEILAQRSGMSEIEVANRAVEMARSAESSPADSYLRHVGTYLIGERKQQLWRQLNCRECLSGEIRNWIYSHSSLVYFSAVALTSTLLLFLTLMPTLNRFSLPIQALVLLLTLLPASQLAIEICNYLLTRLMPPRTLPKLDFKPHGIPDEFRTLVVVPMMLIDAETIDQEVEKLEIRYLANKDPNLLFSLFSDFTDAGEPYITGDRELLEQAMSRLAALNQRYGEDRFFLFHRNRVWSPSEQNYIGWERKRGKLEELNQLLTGTRPPQTPQLVHVGKPQQLSHIRFVITLDSDTQLPHGTALRMIETLAHPLNQPRFDADGKVVAGTYTIIQPRVTPTLASTSATLFSRLFATAVGIDPYTQAISDVYQDLCGAGTYHGKGIYDVRAFHRVLADRFPEERILSHDLIEGSHVNVGLASDIVLYDDFPSSYQSYSRRSHRWIRGDWQLTPWLLPRVPNSEGSHAPNPLATFERWKVFDNLRRSLFPVASLLLLVTAWAVSPTLGGAVTLLLAAQLLFHPIAHHLTMATTRRGFRNFTFGKLVHDLLRSAADAALLPHQAAVTLNAIIKVGYRRLISKRLLLEWTPQSTLWKHTHRQVLFIVSLAVISLLCAVGAATLYLLKPASLIVAAPWLSLWFGCPFLGWLLNRGPQKVQREKRLSAPDRLFLRTVARRTWRYFSDFVGPETSWLPPDNYQVSHQNKLAMRTSPTNIGLWMASAIAAHDYGYISVNQVIEKLSATMGTLKRLERYKGHLLNWYDIETLAPLEPRYVSSVDSGNLIGTLWTLEQGLTELIQAPLLDKKAFSGLCDTLRLLTEPSAQGQRSAAEDAELAALRQMCEIVPPQTSDALYLLRAIAENVMVLASRQGCDFADHPLPSGSDPSHDHCWTREMARQISAWVAMADTYLSWIDILAEKPEEQLNELGLIAVHAIRHDLTHAPSLQDLADGRIATITLLGDIRRQHGSEQTPMTQWIDRVVAAFNLSQQQAKTTLAIGNELINDLRQLSDEIDMGFLYDRKRKLFSIGYNLSVGRLDNAYYDLLATEARLGSYVSIADGSVPLEHWFAMGRPYGAIGSKRVLLSWTGTMFEYLMPLLFQHSYGKSLLDKAARQAVNVQISYARKRRIPWGISESAHGDLDLNKTYQYKAFGVPELGLKRMIEEQLVVAPYASMLAIGIAPQATIANLKQLAGYGLLNEYGYYEAIDFSRQPSPDSECGVIVKAYMAHHQGMAFLALTNFLCDNPFPRRFHATPQVRAFELLLQEQIPVLPPLHYIATQKTTPMLLSMDQISPTTSTFHTPHTAIPRTQLLCNGSYTVMVTNAGGGYSQWRDYELSRWRSDRTCDGGGVFCYLHDPQSDQQWSTTYHPIEGEADQYTVHFTSDRAIFQRSDKGLYSETEIVVSPQDDVEIRRITLVNRSAQQRHLNLTSYVELAMAPHNVDRQHPAFNKLFIETEALKEQRVLLAHRRPRSDSDPALYVAHRLTLHTSEPSAWEFETDRRAFIGRGNTLATVRGGRKELTNSQGFVLDPILSLRQQLSLDPGEQVRISLVIAAGESRHQVLELMEKYSEPQIIDWAMDFSWIAAQQQLRMLRIHPDDARRFQKLASHLLFPNNLLRASAKRLEENQKGQAGLWPYAISGDWPIALVTISETNDIALVRQLLQAHAYWSMHGLIVDLIILNEEDQSYDRPLHERLEQLINAHHSLLAGRERTGSVFLRSSEQVQDDDLRLFKAVAQIFLVATRGTLAKQLAIPDQTVQHPEPLPIKPPRQEPELPLPELPLTFFNGFGGFTADGREYVITLPPGLHTPAPWVNVMANPSFGTMVSETGSGFTWFGNSQRNRLTPWSNDPVLDPPAEAIYLRDEESGIFWTPTAAPVRDKTAYRIRHGAGYSVFEHNSQGIEQQLTVFVPQSDQEDQPIKLQQLQLTNHSGRHRKLSLTYYVEWVLGENHETSNMHVRSHWDNDARALLAKNCYHPDYSERIAFAALTPDAESYSADRCAFIGRNRSLANPAALEELSLPQTIGAGLDPCAALRLTLTLAPGETTRVACLVGQAATMDAAQLLLQTYRENQAVDTALEQTKSWWDALLGGIEVQTPDPSADLLINRWLQYQSLSCRIWGRSAFYQSGGAFGFRDQLQDVMAFLYTKPELAREQILLAASRQFEEGDVQHWWHPPFGAGIRSRISDDLLWLPHVVAQYLRTTGDTTLLQEKVPFITTAPLADNEHEVFAVPEPTFDYATIFEHCQRAVKRGLTQGPNGLPLFGTGDWNDGMNLVGSEGRGESVWLGWFLAELLTGMVQMAEQQNQPQLAADYQQQRQRLVQQLEKTAWDGAWYQRGTFDDGSLLGSSTSREAKIDSLPQSWAWLSGAADPVRAEMALESAWQHLVSDEDQLVLLFTPPFNTSQPSPGYIKGYPPGVRENGGQYTHAALWLAMAMARKRDGQRAVHLLQMINPINHSADQAAAEHYRVEPYVVAADVYRLPGQVGLGGWSWYTGSAAWMYRAWIEEVLGLKRYADHLRIDPVIPPHWPGFSLRYRHAESHYAIQVDNSQQCGHGVARVELNGTRLSDGIIPLSAGPAEYTITVYLGPSEHGAKS